MEDEVNKRQANKAYALALRMLARREHSEAELRLKLGQKLGQKPGQKRVGRTSRTEDHPDLVPDLVNSVIADLKQDNLLSNARFAEMLVRSRVNKGYGPRYIQQELVSKGIGQDLIDRYLDDLGTDWAGRAQILVAQRFPNFAQSQQMWQKAARFLQRRGFSSTTLRAVLGPIPY